MRLSRKELDTLLSNSEKCGLSPQNYLLSLLCGMTPKELPPIEYSDILKNLRRINDSLNRIAMSTVVTGAIDAKSYQENYSKLQEQIGEIIRGIY